MNADELRKSFLAVVGQEDFCRFIHRVRKDRQKSRDLQQARGLCFWQEKAWNAFRITHPDAPAAHDDIQLAFSWCYIHEKPFAALETATWIPEQTHNDFDATCDVNFPFCYGNYQCPDCATARDQWILEHPFVPKPKPTIDWADLERCLLLITTDEIRRFAAVHAGQSHYAFMFDCNSDYGQVLLCLNTEDALAAQAFSNKSDYPDLYGDKSIDEIESKLRWNAGDWLHQGFESSEFHETWRPYESVVYDNCVDETKDRETRMSPTQQQFMDSVCRVAIQLERTDAFQTLNGTKDFKIFVADHDEWEDTSWERLESVRNGIPGEQQSV